MARCQHCNKLTHSEHLYVEYDIADMDKIKELTSLVGWTPGYQYYDDAMVGAAEYGKLLCGDIYIHFIAKNVEVKHG